MRTRMKYFILLLLTITTSSVTFAAEVNEKINTACLRHAVSLVAQLKADVVSDLSQAQSDQALKIATETCQAYFNKSFSETTTSNTTTANNTNEDTDKDSDWFTDKILNGEVVRKDGNKRLMKRR